MSLCLVVYFASAINIFVFYHQNHLAATYEEKLKSALEAQEKDYYMLQCKLMQESVEQVKALRHDMKLHLKDSLFIKVDNAFDGNIKYKWASGGNPDYIESRKKGRDHGYGLRNIREAVEKYNGHIDISHEGNMFSVGVLLYSPSGEDEEETEHQEQGAK